MGMGMAALAALRVIVLVRSSIPVVMRRCVARTTSSFCIRRSFVLILLLLLVLVVRAVTVFRRVCLRHLFVVLRQVSMLGVAEHRQEGVQSRGAFALRAGARFACA